MTSTRHTMLGAALTHSVVTDALLGNLGQPRAPTTPRAQHTCKQARRTMASISPPTTAPQKPCSRGLGKLLAVGREQLQDIADPRGRAVRRFWGLAARQEEQAGSKDYSGGACPPVGGACLPMRP